ncbi:uncharacterized protein LOC108092772 [Drosophila ficusphila]|uniref:uncharacterized protein LOC108092772 n=1 Tax=Drosophila ficusphila TaxID=30025 RepID=UPI001C89B2F1|nr:uncharacterized protein LOC108092772 [Drosophila ficusphila]
MVIVQHQRNRNCSLQDWNPQGFPVLRSTEVGGFKLRGTFNHNAVALVCIGDLSDIKLLETGSLFHEKNLNYQGKTAVVKQTAKVFFRVEERAFLEFASKYNLSLKFIDKNDSKPFDIEMTSRFLGKEELPALVGYLSPRLSSSLIAVVPCREEKSIKEVFKQLDLQKCLFYIICIYVLLVLVETFLQVVTHRISGRTYTISSISSLVNLRVFRAILGMPFPVHERAFSSLRQLFFAMSVFGMVVSSFFGCKLSAMLTKHPLRPQVTNFEELRASGLTALVDIHMKSYIENEIDSQFFQKVMTKVEFLQKSFSFMNIIEGSVSYCTSKDLEIIHNSPKIHIQHNNSIYIHLADVQNFALDL